MYAVLYYIHVQIIIALSLTGQGTGDNGQTLGTLQLKLYKGRYTNFTMDTVLYGF